MARDFLIPGEAMVFVRGPASSSIAGNGNQLGLSEDQIRVAPKFKYKDINVNAWGSDQVPVDVQRFLAWVDISMNLVHFDRDFLDECKRLMMGGTLIGRTGRTGSRIGAGLGRWVQGNNYIGIAISSPVVAKPWRFWYCHMTEDPVEYPIGTERSVVAVNFRAIPYTADPWGGGTETPRTQPFTTAGQGSGEAVIWDHAAGGATGNFD